MGRPYGSTVAESKAAMLENNNTPGAKYIAYYLKPNGFKMERNGCTFREVVLCTVNKQTGKPEEVELIEAELVRPDGTRFWEYKSANTFVSLAHVADPLVAFATAWKEGIKGRKEQMVEKLIERVQVLKGANIPASAMASILIGEGYDKQIVSEAIKL